MFIFGLFQANNTLFAKNYSEELSFLYPVLGFELITYESRVYSHSH